MGKICSMGGSDKKWVTKYVVVFESGGERFLRT
jgi:hypothetical protein